MEQPQSAGLVASARQVDHIAVEIAQAAQDRTGVHRAAELDPVIASGQALAQPLVPDAPAAVDEIEVVLSFGSIAFAGHFPASSRLP
jgi:hypothetical protein